MKLISTVALSLVLLVTSSQLLAGSYAVFYLDDSSSMTQKLPTGSDRCLISKDVARKSVLNFFEKWGGEAIDIRKFSDAGAMVSLTNGFTLDKNAALSAITDSSCAGNSTALADAICQGVNDLQDVGTSLDASTKLLLVVATDGEENSSAGECGGEEWREKVAEKVEATSPRINMNMNVFGKLDEINVGIAASSSISSTSLSYFSNLSESSGGFAMFVDDNSSELPKFFNMFPNEKKFINQLQLSREDVTPWKVPTVDNSLGYKNLLINESALKGIKNRIDAFKNPSTKVKDDWRIDRLNKVQPIKYSPLKIDKWVRPTKADLHFKESAIKDAQTILKKLPQKF